MSLKSKLTKGGLTLATLGGLTYAGVEHPDVVNQVSEVVGAAGGIIDGGVESLNDLIETSIGPAAPLAFPAIAGGKIGYEFSKWATKNIDNKKMQLFLRSLGTVTGAGFGYATALTPVGAYLGAAGSIYAGYKGVTNLPRALKSIGSGSLSLASGIIKLPINTFYSTFKAGKNNEMIYPENPIKPKLNGNKLA